MIDISDFISDVIQSYSDEIIYVHGGLEDANINVNDLGDQVIYFERPYKLTGQINQSGLIEGTYTIDLFFLNRSDYKNEGDNTLNSYQVSIDAKAINPAMDSIETFLAALWNTATVKQVNSFNIVDITDFPEFDNNLSGAMLAVSFTLYVVGNVCAKPAKPIPPEPDIFVVDESGTQIIDENNLTIIL